MSILGALTKGRKSSVPVCEKNAAETLGHKYNRCRFQLNNYRIKSNT